MLKSVVFAMTLTCAVCAVCAAEVSEASEANGRGEPIAGQITSEFGCQLDYEYYEPESDKTVITVILAHGFMRSLSTMRGWAQHWLTKDIATVVVSFCNSSLLNGHHQRNAADLVALRTHLEVQGVIYAGYSAGGLAAYLAALQDDETLGYLGLDSVDSGNLASKQDRSLKAPVLFLSANPSACNAYNNMQETVVSHGYPLSSIEGATHCHFELPYDKRCGWLCGRSTPEETLAIQADIINQATAWVLSSSSH